MNRKLSNLRKVFRARSAIFFECFVDVRFNPFLILRFQREGQFFDLV
jgi:hypothetical protein